MTILRWIVILLLWPAVADAQTWSLMWSAKPDRSGAVPLQGATVKGNAYIFVAPVTALASGGVRFYLDDPARARPPRQTENTAVYDFAGTTPDGVSGQPWDSNKVADGSHTVTAAVPTTGGELVLNATFTVANVSPPPIASRLTITYREPSTSDCTGKPAPCSPELTNLAGTTIYYRLGFAPAVVAFRPKALASTGGQSRTIAFEVAADAGPIEVWVTATDLAGEESAPSASWQGVLGLPGKGGVIVAPIP